MGKEYISFPLTVSRWRIAPIFRIVGVPAPLDKCFRTLYPRFHWDQDEYFRLLVLAMVSAWGRRNVPNLYRYLDAQHHRTCFNNFFLIQQWDPKATLLQKAQELLRALHPTPEAILYLVIDDSKQMKWGQTMDAIAKWKDLTLDASTRGHQDICGILVFAST
jgi:hypothetical protein